jgi:hypothetical protein
MTGKTILTELLAGLDGVTAVMLTAKQAKELGEYVEKIDRERDEARNDEWLAAITAVQFMVANWHQDCRSKIEHDALNNAAEDIISGLKNAGPTEYLDMKWKDAEAAVAAESRASALEQKLKVAREAAMPLAILKIPKNPLGNAAAYSIRYSDIERARALFNEENDQ